MKIIQLPRRGRVGRCLTMQFMAVFVVLGTVNGFAGNYVHYPHYPQTSFVAQQQRRTVSGTVTDANGEAVIGANVMEKGTSNGTVTDSDGRFSLTIESGGVLLVSYIGYLGQEVNTAGRSSFDIVLREDSRSLEEVVVVGYGTQKKVNLTGALASVGRDEVKSISTANLVTGLAGKLPGLKVTQRTGEPGAYKCQRISNTPTVGMAYEFTVLNTENKNEPGEAAWNVIKFTWMNIPTYPVYANDNPEYLQDMTYPWNPVAMTTASIGGYTKTKTKTFQGNMVLTYDMPFIERLQVGLIYVFYN